MITDAEQAADRLIQFFETGEMPTASGGSVKLAADSICIHGDSAHAVDMAVQLRAALIAHGFETPFIRGCLTCIQQCDPFADTWCFGRIW